jgi:hypothetical protein
MMDLSKKLQIPTGTSTFVTDAPKGFDLGTKFSGEETGAAVLVFVVDTKELKTKAKPAIKAAKEDRLS